LPAPLRSRKLLFVTGKGGVGKTTVSAALALHLARIGRRVLLVECGDVSSLGSALGAQPPGYERSQVRPGISACRITPSECLREYGLRKLRFRRIYSAIFENAFVKALVGMLPGMEELLLVGKIGFMAQTAGASGRSSYDVVIVDSPPTSQGLGILAFPSIMLSAIGSGLAAREIGRIHALLADPAATGVIIVTLPEEMAVDEALELESQVNRRVHLPACAVIVNRLVPDVPTEAPPSQPFQPLELLRSLREQQDAQVARLARQTNLPVLRLPLLLPDSKLAGSKTTVADPISNELASELDKESL